MPQGISAVRPTNGLYLYLFIGLVRNKLERVSTEEVVTSLDLLYKQMPRETEKYIENMGQDRRSTSRYLNHKPL